MKQKDSLWVEIEVNKYEGGITVFRGKIDLSDLRAWESGDLIDGAIKLQNTYWFLENSTCVLGEGEGPSRQYSGDTYIRSDSILCILVLRDNQGPHAQKPDQANVLAFPGRK